MVPDRLTLDFTATSQPTFNLELSTLNNDLAISVRNVSKIYPLYSDPQARLRQSLWYALPKFLRGSRTPEFYREFWALRNISFEVKRGEALGIIGRNGSGKSTLLQIIAGTLTPTAGEVQVNGRVAALLELGSGFNPEFTGRENVYLNGSILGFSREEMDNLFDEIAAFADIGEFMDQPVKHYSSGMSVRLAFAVQACIEPDILIVDEALAVGDIGFQRKCYRRIENLKKNLKTSIILVTHDINAVVNYCNRALLLNEGQVIHAGDPKLITELYHKQIFGEDIKVKSVETYGDGKASIDEVWLENASGDKITSVPIGDTFSFCYYIDFHCDVSHPIFGMRTTTIQGLPLISINTFLLGKNTGQFRNGDRVKVCWRIKNSLNVGYYFFSCGCAYSNDDSFMCRRVDVLKLAIIGSSKEAGLLVSVLGADIYRE